MKLHIHISFFFFLYTYNITATSTPRTMIMILDEDGEQTSNALKKLLLKSLFDKNRPILTSSLLFKNIITTIQHNKKTNEACISGSEDDHICSLLQEIDTLRTIPQPTLSAIKSLTTGFSLVEEEERFNLYVDLLNFDAQEWHFYTLNDEYILCVPRFLLQLDQKNSLGLSVHELKEIEREAIITNTFSATPSSSLTNPQVFLKMLKSLFSSATNGDQWYFYVAGHGTPVEAETRSAVSAGNYYLLIEKARNLKEQLLYTENTPLSATDYQDIRVALTTLTNSSLNTFLHLKGIATLLESPTDISMLQDLIDTQLEIIKTAHLLTSQPTSRIAGMTIKTLKTFLEFLNNSIKTDVLYYVTCFAGGIHAEIPYLTENLSDERYNFTIISQAATNQVTGSRIDGTSFEKRGSAITLFSTLNFNRFFDGLIQRKPFVDFILNVSNIFIKSDRLELPQVRYKNMSTFIPLDIAIGDLPTITQSVHLTDTRLKIYLAEEKPLRLSVNTVLTVDQTYIPLPIIITSEKVAIVAKSNSIPILFDVIFAPTLTLDQIVAVFNKKINQPILIKTLIIQVQGQQKRLTNVLIDLQALIFKKVRKMLNINSSIYAAFNIDNKLLTDLYNEKTNKLEGSAIFYPDKQRDMYNTAVNNFFDVASSIFMKNKDLQHVERIINLLKKRKEGQAASSAYPSIEIEEV